MWYDDLEIEDLILDDFNVAVHVEEIATLNNTKD